MSRVKASARRGELCAIKLCRRSPDKQGLCTIHLTRILEGNNVTDYVSRRYERSGPEYNAWVNMRHRCNPAHADKFPAYAGRGIRVCNRWLDSVLGFDNFMDDLGTRPEGHTLERNDSNGDYTPDNCRWATWDDQYLTRRSTVIVEREGIPMSMSKASKLVHGSAHVIKSRLKHGWTLDEAISTPYVEGSRNARIGV